MGRERGGGMLVSPVTFIERITYLLAFDVMAAVHDMVELDNIASI